MSELQTSSNNLFIFPSYALEILLRLMKSAWALILIALLVVAVSLPIYLNYAAENENKAHEDPFFFGVTYGSNTTLEAKLLIDKIKGYTNLFIVDSWDISTNETALNEICQYAVDSGMSVIVYFDYVFFETEQWSWLRNWMEATTQKWGDKFLGIYLYDEPGGNQIDTNQWRSGASAKEAMENSSDYSDAANRFVTNIPSTISWRNVRSVGLPIFTSDYALYWFDYLVGYDTIFVELGWNISSTQQIALCRGAANVQGKDWGAIITWTYYQPPYIVRGPEIYDEMISAYHAGAKYIVVFDFPKYPETNPYGILSEEHFTAMKQFWNYAQAHPRTTDDEAGGQVALVLPKDYGWGMRRSQQFREDRIWGFWPEDQTTLIAGSIMSELMNRYGLQLDIIYDDPRFNYQEMYTQIYFWNSTIT